MAGAVGSSSMAGMMVVLKCDGRMGFSVRAIRWIGDGGLEG